MKHVREEPTGEAGANTLGNGIPRRSTLAQAVGLPGRSGPQGGGKFITDSPDAALRVLDLTRELITGLR